MVVGQEFVSLNSSKEVGGVRNKDRVEKAQYMQRLRSRRRCFSSVVSGGRLRLSISLVSMGSTPDLGAAVGVENLGLGVTLCW